MNIKNHLCKLIFVFTLFISASQLYAGIMEKPRQVYSLSTAHFNILFSNPSADTAKLVAENIEFMYEKACITFSYNYTTKPILVIISPDSDTLSITYTNSPFDRIVIFDSVPSSADESYVNGFLDLLNHEVQKAVESLVIDDFLFWFKDHLVGNVLQPVTLINVPFSFLEGATSAEDYKYNTGLLNDKWTLQQLTQAKLENKFPSLIQVLGTMDVYPGKDFCRLAASAFCAYIQQKYGYEKFYEYWNMGGQLNFFFLHKGIFQKVYDVSLEEEWEHFIEAIPVPQLAENDESEIFFNNNSNKSLYKFLLHSQYGFIWYDELKGEVAIYDDTLGFQKNRRLLFLANDITNLTLSPNGRFLVVSHTQYGSRDNFKENKARVYDLQNRDFTGDKFDLRDASLIQLEDGTYAIAGISVKDKIPQLQIIPADKTNKMLDLCYAKNSSPIFTRKYNIDTIPSAPIQIDKSKLIYIVTSHGQKYLTVLDFNTREEQILQIQYENEILDIKNLKLNDISFLSIAKTYSSNALVFNYISKFESSLSKIGLILLDKENKPQQIVLQTDTLSGGLNDAVFIGGDLFYASNLYDQDEFRKIQISKINLESGELIYPEITFSEPSEEKLTVTESINEKNKKEYFLDEYQIEKFHSISYMLKGAPIPFLPVKSISLKEGIEQSPGLGMAFTTGADPFDNNELTISAGFGFLPTDIRVIFNASEDEMQDFDFSEIKFFDDYTFAAYYKNSSTPIDILASSLYTFNKEGQYSFDVTGGLKWEVPLMMTFRRFTFFLEGNFTSSSTYWDQHQFATYPELYNWPSFSDSYRTIDTNFEIVYSNIHQFGISPYKKMGIEAGISLDAIWDLNLMELQAEKRKSGTVESVKPENLTQAIENQLWANPYAPTQINLGIYATAEIPQLLPVDNINNWIICLPTTIYSELFYTNGIALDFNVKTLLFGKEIQDGFNQANLYFPRAGLYFGYDIQRKYDTNSVVLPDVRDFFRFYEAFSNTTINDSIYFDINLALTPVIGSSLSSLKMNTDLMLQYYLRSEVFAVNFNISFDL